jgi:site-specific DNA recombinase
MRAALYGRFSTEKQRDASIEDQFRECERLAQANSLTVVARFSDAGISGGTASRPGYQAMLTAARRREFDVIVVEEIERLWRNRAEFGPRSAELEDLGVHCLTCVGDDTRRDGWGLIIQIKQAMGEHARRQGSYRTRRGLEGRALAGESTGGRAFGYVPAALAASGRIEIDDEQALVVRRIFTDYAHGLAPRAIAAALNAEGVPSPGAHWKKRTERRRDGKWLASAIHGDATRGTGILNNRRYIGVVTWGRSEWKRSAADSAKRRMTMRAGAVERTDERLQIIPQDLWDRVKARQVAVQRGVGKLIKGGLRRNAPGAGRPPKFLFSGLMTCASCGASMVLRNRTCYCCASYWNGAACSNEINVPVGVVQSVLIDGIREDLRDPAVVAEFERRFEIARRSAQRPRVGTDKRAAQLEREIANMTNAIAAGLVSSALAVRLREAEAELARLTAVVSLPRRIPVGVPNVRESFARMVGALDQILLRDPERGREELRGILGGEKIKCIPDASRKFLWADYSLGLQALVPNAEIMVAGARFSNFRRRRALRRAA